MSGWGEIRAKPPCAARDCDRESWSKGLCLKHYKRARRGASLDPPRPIGDPDGYGRYGILDIDDDGVLCHECGQRYRSVGSHLAAAHEMTARDYKIIHGLPLRKALALPEVRQRLVDAGTGQVGTDGWSRLEAARDPTAAAHARDEAAFSRPGVVSQQLSAVSAERGRASRQELVRSCLTCGVQWCPLPPRGYWRQTCSSLCWTEWQSTDRVAAERVNADRDRMVRAEFAKGVSRRALADRLGVSTQRIGQILRDDPLHVSPKHRPSGKPAKPYHDHRREDREQGFCKRPGGCPPEC